MVALNTAYAAPKNAADPKDRVGDFFYEDRASVGKNRWAKRLNAQEKSCYHYETASGRSNWLSRDPIAENGGINLYAYVGNDLVNYWDPYGEAAALALPAFAGGSTASGGTFAGGSALVGGAILGNQSLGARLSGPIIFNPLDLFEALFSEGASEGPPLDGAGKECDEGELTPTGEVVEKPSTNRRNKGGTVKEEGFKDSQGRDVSKQTILDGDGNVSTNVKQPNPHFRPGPPKI